MSRPARASRRPASQHGFGPVLGVGIGVLLAIVIAAAGFVAWILWADDPDPQADHRTAVVTETSTASAGDTASAPVKSSALTPSDPTPGESESGAVAEADSDMPAGLTYRGWSGTTAVCNDGETLAFGGRGPDGTAVVCESAGTYIYRSALFGGSLEAEAHLQGPTFYVPTDDSLITVSDGGFGVRQGGARVTGGEFSESWRPES